MFIVGSKWRLSPERLVDPTSFVHRSPELPLPMTTNNQPRRYTGISGGCAGREAGRKQKTQSSKTAFHHKNRIYRKQKAAQQTTLRKFQERKFFFLTIYLYLCNRQSGSLKWQNKVEYRSSLVSLSLPTFIGKQFNLLIIWCL